MPLQPLDRTSFLGLSCLLAMLLFTWATPAPHMHNSPDALRDEGSVDAQNYTQFRQDFGSDQGVVLQIHTENPKKLLQHVRSAHEILATTEIVEGVQSLYSLFPSEIDALLDPDFIIENRDEFFKSLEDHPLNSALHLYDVKHSSAVLLAQLKTRLPEDRLDTDFDHALQRIDSMVRKDEDANSASLTIAGGPLLDRALGAAGKKIETRALPLLAFISALIMFLSFRNIGAVLALLAPVGLVLISTEHVLGLLELNNNLIINIFKPLLFVLLIASGTHIVLEYQRGLYLGLSPQTAAREAIARKAKAILWALLTSMFGFGSLAFANTTPLRVLGGIVAFGLLLGAFILLLSVPWLLQIVVRKAGKVRTQTSWAGNAAKICIDLAEKYPKTIVVFGFIGCLLGIFSLPKLDMDAHAIHYFEKNHPVRKAHDELDARGLGLASLEWSFTATGSLVSNNVFDALDKWTNDAQKIPGIRSSIHPGMLFYDVKSKRRADIFFIEEALNQTPAQFESLIQDKGKKWRVRFWIQTQTAEEIENLSKKLRAILPASLAHLDSYPTGTYWMILQTQKSLLQTLTQSLSMTALCVFLALCFLTRKLSLSLFAMLPNLFPIALNFAFMWWMDWPLDVGTAMTAAIMLGIALDDTIHFLTTREVESSLQKTALSAGPGMILSSVIVGFGFASLIPSEFIPSARFGTLATLAIITATFGDLLILPAIVALRERYEKFSGKGGDPKRDFGSLTR